MGGSVSHEEEGRTGRPDMDMGRKNLSSSLTHGQLGLGLERVR